MDRTTLEKFDAGQMDAFDFFHRYDRSTQIELDAEKKHNEEILQLLPLLGPLFGLSVLSFGIWDYLIDPAQALSSFYVRLVLVVLGSSAYFVTRLNWTPLKRCVVIYSTHAGAIIICEFLLKNGFLLGLTGICACVFAVSVVTIRLKIFFKILSLPTLLFITLSAIRLPLIEFLNGAMLYIFSVSLACLIMLVIRSFRMTAVALENELLQISRHDSLTGAYNRGYLTDLANREVALAKRHNRNLSIAMLDIDHFKKVNDTYGHDIGDKTIKLLVDTCQKNLREIDHFGRIGGEEFVCVLPEVGAADAMLCAERLRTSIEALQIETPSGPLRFTVSIGVAELNAQYANWETLLKEADKALYNAKNGGRNRSVLAGSL
jgi:diguanylate cyclase (GGDEF)-like protein